VVKTYDSNKVVVTYGGHIVSGFTDGGKVKVANNSQDWTLQMGTDGDGTRSRSNDESAQVTLMLKGSSKSNDVLSGFRLADKLTGAGVLPLLIKDLQGITVFSGLCWIQKAPDTEIGRENHDFEWVLETDKLISAHGGI
jgi:hypothetical protein